MWHLRAIILVSLVSATLGTTALFAQESSPITVSLPRGGSNDPITAESGSSLTIPLRIANRASASILTSLKVRSPDGWSIGLLPESILLLSSETVSRIVLIRIPAGAPAGTYRVGFRLEGQTGDLLADLERTVLITRACDIEISSDIAARYVEAGSGIVAPVTIRNKANVPVRIRLDARVPKGYEVVMNSNTHELAVGEEQAVPIFVRTPSEELERVRRSIVIGASAENCGDLRKTAAVSFDVVPTRSGELVSGARTIPGRLALIGGATAGRAGGQVQMTISGPIDEERDRRVDVEAIFPDRGGLRFGERSSFRLSYKSETLTAEAGDLSIGFTTLTRVPGKGRGFRVRSEFGPYFVHGFWARPRFGFPVRLYTGASTGIRFSKSTSVAVNFLSQSGVDQRQSVTVAAEFEPDRFGKLGIEVGDAVRNGAGGGAVAVNVAGSIDKRLFLAGRYVHAGGGLPGQFSNYDFRQVSATFRPADGLSVQLTGRNEEQSFEPSVGEEFWRRRLSKVKGGVGLREKKIAAELFTTYGRRYVAGGSFSSADENDAGVDVRLMHSFVAFGMNVRLGQYRDRSLGLSDTFTRLALTTTIGGDDNSMSMSLERLDGRTIARPLAGSVWAGRLAIRVEPFSHTRFELDAFSSRDGFFEDGLYHLFYLRAAREVWGGGKIEGRMQYGSFGVTSGGTNVDFGIGLTVPLEVPNPFHSKEKPIAGRVVDFESGQPLSGVLVQLGNRVALTDYEGRFQLRRPGAGQYLFRIDMSTVSVEYVPMAELPLAIDVREQETNSIEVGMARAARAFVMLRRQATHNERAEGLPALVPVDAAVIELEDDYGRRRALTNVAGKITFTGLRPGHYVARVVYADLPPNYEMKQDVYSFTINPGGSADLEMLAVSAGRNIQIISSGDLTIEPFEKGIGPAVSDSAVSESSGDCRPRPATTRFARAGETLSTIARDVYGDALLWPFLWLPNRDSIPDPDRIDVGDELRIEVRNFRVEHRDSPTTREIDRVGMTAMEIAAAEIGHLSMWPVVWYSNRDSVSPNGSVPQVGGRLIVPGIRVSEEISAGFCDD